MAAIEGAAVAPRRRLGIVSLLCALGGLAAAFASLLLFANMPAAAPDAVKTAITVLFMIVFFAAAPLTHLIGLVLGVVALFRRGDSRVAAGFGVFLNAILLPAGVIFVLAWLNALAAFR